MFDFDNDNDGKPSPNVCTAARGRCPNVIRNEFLNGMPRMAPVPFSRSDSGLALETGLTRTVRPLVAAPQPRRPGR